MLISVLNSVQNSKMKTCLLIFWTFFAVVYGEKVLKSRPNYGRPGGGQGMGNICSFGCQCMGNSANCRNSGLDDIPNNLSPFLDRLDLQNNRLISVSSMINSYGRLQTLLLNFNNIDGLDSKNFDQLNSLIDLELANNQLNELPDGVFDGKFIKTSAVASALCLHFYFVNTPGLEAENLKIINSLPKSSNRQCQK